LLTVFALFYHITNIVPKYYFYIQNRRIYVSWTFSDFRSYQSWN